jgi:uncharacterized metal-binding protein
MPNHKTHDRTGLLLTPAVVAGGYISHLDINHLTILTFSYVVATYLLTPDLDTNSAPYHRWRIFRFLWFPYKQLIPHRSLLSHSGPISGTIRFLYFMSILVGILWALGIQPMQLLTLASYFGILWVSIVLVDIIHVILDLVWKD